MSKNLPDNIKSPKKNVEISKADDCFVMLTFGKSNSPSFKFVLALAPTADLYRYDEETGLYSVGFHNRRESLERATVILKNASGWKTTLCFINGKLRTAYSAEWMIDCYLKGLNCTDKIAHCHTVTGVVGSHQLVEVSCKLAVNHAIFEHYITRNGEQEKQFVNTKASYEAQLQAWAVQSGCDLCPFFKAEVEVKEALQESTVVDLDLDSINQGSDDT